MKKIYKLLLISSALIVLSAIPVFYGVLRGNNLIQTENLTSSVEDPENDILTVLEHSSSLKEETEFIGNTNKEFSSNIEIAYKNEAAILKGRELVIGFYNIKDKVIQKDFFSEYAEEPIAKALYQQVQELTEKKQFRDEKLTTYTIHAETPLTIWYTVVGKNLSQQEEVTYEVIFNELHTKINSFRQIDR